MKLCEIRVAACPALDAGLIFVNLWETRVIAIMGVIMQPYVTWHHQVRLHISRLDDHSLLTTHNMNEIYLNSARKRFREYKDLGDKTIARLTDEQLSWTPNDESNSIAVIIQHMHGNMISRWTNFLTEDGEKEWRKRDEEFERQGLTKNKVLELWNDGWKVCLETLDSLSPEDMSKEITIRSQSLSVPPMALRSFV